MDLILLQPGDLEIVGEDNSQASSFIDGQGNDLDHGIQNSIEIISMNQGMQQQVTTDVSNSARTSGRPVISDITLVKYVDRTSTKLYQHCLTGKPIGKGDNTSKIYMLRNSGDRLGNIMTLELKDAIVSSIDFQSHPNDMPTEQVMLNFTEVVWTFNAQSNDGTLADTGSHGWSIARNRPIDKISG